MTRTPFATPSCLLERIYGKDPQVSHGQAPPQLAVLDELWPVLFAA